MQPFFDAANNKDTINNIIKLVKEAKRFKHKIFILEYRLCGKTISSIRKEIGNYEFAHYIKKSENDGSIEMLQHLSAKEKYNFKVCGVYTSKCVAQTAKGLARIKCSPARERFKLRIKLDACHTFYSEYKTKKGAERLFKNYKNIVVI